MCVEDKVEYIYRYVSDCIHRWCFAATEIILNCQTDPSMRETLGTNGTMGI